MSYKKWCEEVEWKESERTSVCVQELKKKTHAYIKRRYKARASVSVLMTRMLAMSCVLTVLLLIKVRRVERKALRAGYACCEGLTVSVQGKAKVRKLRLKG